MPILSQFLQNSRQTILFFLSVVTAITLTPWRPAEADENDGPVIRLHGKVILPEGVGHRDLICELVELVYDQVFDFEVSPITIKNDLTFETQTMGLNSRSVITVRTRDRKWKGSWLGLRHELLSKSAAEIVLELLPSKPQPVQVIHDSQPQAGATVFVWDEFYVEPIKTNKEGIVFLDPAFPQVFLAAIAKDRLVGYPGYVTLPIDGSTFQLELKEWELEPVQVVGTDGKPVGNVAIAFGSIGNEKLCINPELKSLFARSDSNGMTTPVLFSDSRDRFDLFSSTLRFVSFNRSTKPHRVVVAPVQPNVDVRGKLKLPEGISDGLLLLGLSFQSEVPDIASKFQCRVKRDGSFVASVHPEYNYCVNVLDATWVSAPWTGIMASTKTDMAKPLSLEIVPGEAVEVLLTRGKDLAPASGVWVVFSQPHSISWMEEGQQRSRSSGPVWQGYSDEDGIVTTRANLGELQVSLNGDAWKANLKSTVRSGETTSLWLHKEELETVPFEGRVKFVDRVETETALSQVRIELWLYDVYRPTAKLTVDNEGRFHGKAAKPRIALLAQTEDRKYRGVQVVDLEVGNAEPLVIELNPSVSVYGRIVDSDGFSFPSAKVEFDLRPLIRWPKKEPFGGTSFHTENLNTTTDKGGRYVFHDVCSRVPSAMFVHYINSAQATTVLYNNTLEPPIASLPTVVLPEDELSSSPLQTRIKNRVDSSKLLNTNAVLVYHGSDKSAINMAMGLFGRGAFGATSDLSPLIISDAKMKADPANAVWLNEQGWGLSNDQELLLVLFDQTGKEITSKRVQSTDNINAISEIINAKQIQLVPQSRNAKMRFENALELARQTDRDVWINFVSIRNPASIALLRWQYENRIELEKHFILMQIDWIRDEKAEAIMDRYGVTRDQAPNLIGVLVNQEGLLLQDTSGESPYKAMQPSQFLDRDRIGALMKAASKPIDPSQLKAWIESM